MRKEEVIRQILRDKLIVIVRGVTRTHIVPLMEALYEGGVRLAEITYDASGKRSDEEVSAMIGDAARAMDGRMLIGAGTVLKPSQVDLTVQAGGRFIISPDTNADVIARTVALDAVSVPGALTPTEAQYAHRCGADFVKIFPMEAFGAGYLKALCAPLSHIRFLAVGGVTAENLTTFLKNGAVGVGIGSSVIQKDMIEAGDFAAVTELAKKYTEQL